ncbi:glycosyltransferase [Robiginitalea sp. IMCC44478]|uniref:glycosyltransferase n=1 Tax=Robiginitalea sp. IMCC44478 TaxID=3459122 RepID=UPI0040420948
MMIRILHIVGGMQRAGAETLLMNIYRNLDRDKFQFDFLYFTDMKCDYDEEILSLGGRIFRIPPGSTNRLVRIWKRYKRYNILLKKLPEHQIIHSHINLNGAIFLLVASWHKKKLRISHSHISKGKKSLLPRLYRYITRIIIKKYASVYMACGEAAGAYLYPSIDPNDIVVFPNSIDIKAFQDKSNNSEKLRRELKINENTKIITQIGRFTFQKNFEFTISFAEYLIKHGNDLHFVLLGKGPLEEKLKNMVDQKGLNKNFTFYGISSEIPQILHSSDLFFMPSNLEGFPVVLVEAQACGLPCLISTNISREVDMGLNLISFMDLNDEFSQWETALKSSISSRRQDWSEINSKMRERNFDAAQSVKLLQGIYSQIEKI